MFRYLAQTLVEEGSSLNLLLLPPAQLARALNLAWNDLSSDQNDSRLPRFEPRSPGGVRNARAMLTWLEPSVISRRETDLSTTTWPVMVRTDATPDVPVWDHLLYAYLIENTGIYEIIQDVLREYRHGERFNARSPEIRRWLWSTEQLFYGPTPSFEILAIRTDIRPDVRASRRNVYFRMFGADLSHGNAAGHPYPYERPAQANRDFVRAFEELLREVNRGMVGAEPNHGIDDLLVLLCRHIRNMFMARRVNGNLSRDEFVHTSTMSWFHLSLESNDAPLVQAFDAQAPTAGERLFKIAQRVGVAAAAHSDSMLSVADAVSRVLVEIERGSLVERRDVRSLYLEPSEPTRGIARRDDMSMILTHWPRLSGRAIG